MPLFGQLFTENRVGLHMAYFPRSELFSEFAFGLHTIYGSAHTSLGCLVRVEVVRKLNTPIWNRGAFTCRAL